MLLSFLLRLFAAHEIIHRFDENRNIE